MGRGGAGALAVDADGSAVVVWTNRDVHANRYVPGVGWTLAEGIESAAGDPVRGSVDVAFAGSTLLATFAQTDSPIENGYATPFVDDEWGEPELISDGVSRTIFDSAVSVGTDARGNALALMIQQPDTFQIHDVIFARRPAESGEWSSPGFVSSAPGFYRYAFIDVAENGTAVATWAEGDAVGTLRAAIFE
jgi:hypothetical protein